MKKRYGLVLLLVCIAAFIAYNWVSRRNVDQKKGMLSGSPVDNLPAHIEQLTDYGSRASWSPDGKHLLFLDEMIGNVMQIDIDSRMITALTDHYPHNGYTRAMYLPNDDIILCGPKIKSHSPDDPEGGRFDGIMWILRKPYDGLAVSLDEPCWEGIAVSRNAMKIAWAKSDIPFEGFDAVIKLVSGFSEIWTADIEYDNGIPAIRNKKRVLEREKICRLCVLEVQDFRPPKEDELIFSAYLYQGSEIMGYDLNSGKIINYSESPYYEEAEGIFPDGDFTTVERDLAVVIIPGGVDIWKLKLDGSKKYERLTYFNYYKGFGASNPVVRNDGKYMAFQLKDAEKSAGNGFGLFLFHLEAAGRLENEGS